MRETLSRQMERAPPYDTERTRAHTLWSAHTPTDTPERERERENKECEGEGGTDGGTGLGERERR